MARSNDKFDEWDPMGDAFRQRNTINPRTLSGKVALGKKESGSVSLVVTGINPTINESGLRNLFSKIGTVTSVSLTPKNPRFDTLKAFVGMKPSLAAEKAIERFDNQIIFGHLLKVGVAQPLEERRGTKPGAASPWSYNRPPGTFRPSSPPGSVDDCQSEGSVTPVGMGRGRRSMDPSASDDRLRMPPPRASLPARASALLRKPYLLESPPKMALEIGQEAEVFVHADCYVTPTNFSCATKNPEKLNIHARYSSRKPPLGHEFSPEDLVAAPFADCYYRARVLSRQEDNFLVTFIDFGNEAKISRAQMIPLEREDAIIPPLLVKIALEGATEANAKAYTDELVKRISSSSSLTGRILRFDKAQDVFVMEFELPSAQPPPPPPPPMVFSTAPAPPSLPSGERTKLYIDLDTSSLAELDLNAQAEDPKQLLAVIDHYSTPGDAKPLPADAKPPVGAMLAAPYVDCHYRALVTGQAGPAKLRVLFVDFGNEEEISLSEGNVFVLDQQFVDLCPALYLKLRLAGVTDENKQLYVRKLSSLQATMASVPSQLPIEGIVESFDPKTKVCVLDIGLRCISSPPKPRASAEGITTAPSHLASYVHKEIKCTVLEAPEANRLVVIPQEKAGELDEFSQKVSSYSQKASRISGCVRCEQLVLAPFENDFFRATVKQVEEAKGQAHLFFIDFGNWAWVATSELRQFGPDAHSLASKAPFCIPCRVAGVKPPNREAEFPKEAVDKVVLLVGEPPVLMRGLRVAEDQVYGRVLEANFSKQSLPCLAAALIAEGLAESLSDAACAPAPPAASPSPVVAIADEEVPKPLLEDLNCCRFAEVSGETLDMISLHNTSPGFFTMVHPSNINALDTLTAAITEKITKEAPNPIEVKDLAAGRLVIAKFVEEGHVAYYRGCVSRISRKYQLAEVLFIDFGNVGEVDLKFVYPIDPEFLTQPIIPLYCSLSGLKMTTKFPEDVKKRMDKLLQAGKTPPKLRAHVVELMVPETPSSPLVAVVDVEIVGKGPLLEQLSLDRSPPKAGRSPPAPAAAEKRPVAVNGRQSPVLAGVIEKSRTVIVKDEPSVNGVSGSSSKDLEKRVSRLELELADCHKKIYELETLLYGMINAGRGDN